MAPEAKLCVAVLGEATVPPTDSCQINLGQIFASYNISHSLLQLIFVLQRFSVVVTTNIWFSHCYNLFALLRGLCVVTILLQRIHVVTILIQHIACNCYNLFDKPCNNGIFWLLQAFQTPNFSENSSVLVARVFSYARPDDILWWQCFVVGVGLKSQNPPKTPKTRWGKAVQNLAQIRWS